MPNLSLQAFTASLYAGQQLNQEMEERKQNQALKTQQFQANAFELQQKQAQSARMEQANAKMEKLMQSEDQALAEKRSEDGTGPDMAAEQGLAQSIQLNRQKAKIFALADPKASEHYSDAADKAEAKLATVRKTNLELSEKNIKDMAAYAGSMRTENLADPAVRAEIKDRVFKTAGFKAAQAVPEDEAGLSKWLIKTQKQGQTAAEQLTDERIRTDAKLRSDEFVRHHKETEAEARDRMAATAAMRELLFASKAGASAERAERKEASNADRTFKQTEKLQTKLQSEAKDLLGDHQRLRDIQGLLAINSPPADQQVRQALTSVLGNFKGRATNLYYKDNKNFGSVYSRLEGALSRAFTGRYSEESRKEIKDLVDKMQQQVVEPELAALERNAQARAKSYNTKLGTEIDHEQIKIDGSFNRNAAATPKYVDGTVAVNPTTGEERMRLNGKWQALPQGQQK